MQVTQRGASSTYMRTVDHSYFQTSDNVRCILEPYNALDFHLMNFFLRRISRCFLLEHRHSLEVDNWTKDLKLRLVWSKCCSLSRWNILLSFLVQHTLFSHDMFVIFHNTFMRFSWRDLQVTNLMIWVEAMFTDYFAGADRHQARKALKPAQAKRPLRITFFLGNSGWLTFF